MKGNIADVARFLLKRKKYQKAKDYLLSHLDILDRDAEALSMLAFANIFLKDFYAAEEVSRKALRRDSFSTNAMLAKGYISLQNGHRENALREYFRIIDIDPKNKIAKDNIERIRFLTNNAKGNEINPRAYLLGKINIPSYKFFIAIPILLIIALIFYISIDRIYPKIRYILLDKEQKELRKKLEDVYLFEGLEKGDVPDSAKSPTYSPRQVADLFNKAKRDLRGANVNEAILIINGALYSDINEYLKERFRVLKDFVIAPDYNIFKESPDYLTIAENYKLYDGGYVKWKADVSRISQTNVDGIPKKLARILVYDSNNKDIIGIADLLLNVNIDLKPNSYIEAYAKVIGYNDRQKSILLDTQIIKHLPKKKN